MLDTEPLRRSAEQTLDAEQLHANVAAGHLDAVGVAATRIPPDLPKAPTRRDPAEQWYISHAHSVLFLDTTLDASHVAGTQPSIGGEAALVERQIMVAAGDPRTTDLDLSDRTAVPRHLSLVADQADVDQRRGHALLGAETILLFLGQ